jgi:hypothetical protein
MAGVALKFSFWTVENAEVLRRLKPPQDDKVLES